MARITPFLLFIALSLAAGFIGSFATFDAIPTWYAFLIKPFWTPPAWVFGPVWTALYVLMGTSAALVWTSRKLGRFFPLWLFVAHLFVNTLWSVVFFGLHEPGGALVVIAILWLSIAWMIHWFSRYSKLASYLLVPYLLWVTYAATLNVGIVLLNS